MSTHGWKWISKEGKRFARVKFCGEWINIPELNSDTNKRFEPGELFSYCLAELMFKYTDTYGLAPETVKMATLEAFGLRRRNTLCA